MVVATRSTNVDYSERWKEEQRLVMHEIRTSPQDKRSLAGASREFPSRGEGGVDPSTVWRWGNRGLKLPDGRRIRLGIVRVGKGWLTSLGAIHRFLDEMNSVIEEPETTTPEPTPSEEEAPQEPSSPSTEPEPQQPAKPRPRRRSKSAKVLDANGI